jgi:hypothetical protein
MNEMPVEPTQPKKSNTGLIVAVVAGVLLCCCCLLLVVGWTYGDAFMQMLNG